MHARRLSLSLFLLALSPHAGCTRPLSASDGGFDAVPAAEPDAGAALDAPAAWPDAEVALDAPAASPDAGQASDGSTTIPDASPDAPVCGAGLTHCAGACVDTRSDLANCGACGAPCAPAHASEPRCAGGTCEHGACDSGYGDCDGSSATGCETPLTTVSNCGACGAVCGRAGTSSVSCVPRGCVLVCSSRYDDCDGDPSNGCETYIVGGGCP
jgi:hypothetical protein